jgi:cyclin B
VEAMKEREKERQKEREAEKEREKVILEAKAALLNSKLGGRKSPSLLATAESSLAANSKLAKGERPATACKTPTGAPVTASNLLREKVQSSSPREAAAASGSPFRGDKNENIRSVAEYVPDVMNLLLRKELFFVQRPSYMDLQTDINAKMRAILIDWLVEVHMKYKMRQETLFASVNIIDRYVAVKQVPRKRLQLLGVTSMLIAAKFEELRPPSVKDFVYITDHAYAHDEVTNMECSILAALGFRVVVPTLPQFLECFQRANRCDSTHCQVSQYLSELTLTDHRFSRHAPSRVAAAAVLLSNELLGRRPTWPAALVRHSHYEEAALKPCLGELRLVLATAHSSSLQAVRKKYALAKHSAVSKMAALTSA